MTAPHELPETIETEDQLDELLSRPPAEVVELFARLPGPLAIVGGAGKIGPSLVRMACRARDEAGSGQDIHVIDRFPDPAVREALEAAGAGTFAADLLDPAALDDAPPAANVIYMVGMKFGTTGRPALTWAVNGLIPAYVLPRYAEAHIVAFSTGCVYDLVPADAPGAVETDPLTPPGEYANSCVARERIFEHVAEAHSTAMLQMRLNYAVELRYGVLVDLAQAIAAAESVDVTMGCFNCIWQGDVNAIALRLLEHCAHPPRPLNVTGVEKLPVRDVAERMAERMGKPVSFTGTEADTALLSNAREAHRLLGPPLTPMEKVIDWTADWVARGGRDLGKPTHFQTRDGKY